MITIIPYSGYYWVGGPPKEYGMFFFENIAALSSILLFMLMCSRRWNTLEVPAENLHLIMYIRVRIEYKRFLLHLPDLRISDSRIYPEGPSTQ